MHATVERVREVWSIVNELMMTGWLPEVGGGWGCRQAFRSRVTVRSEIGRPDLGGREGASEAV